VGLSIADTTVGTLVANLGFDKVVTPKPTFIGDTLTCSSEVVEIRESRSRPTQGIVVFKHELTNQRGETALSMLRTVLLKRRER
jgi:acyl dehydratase